MIESGIERFLALREIVAEHRVLSVPPPRRLLAQKLHELDHRAVGILAAEHFDPAASQMHAYGRAGGEVAGEESLA